MIQSHKDEESVKKGKNQPRTEGTPTAKSRIDTATAEPTKDCDATEIASSEPQTTRKGGKRATRKKGAGKKIVQAQESGDKGTQEVSKEAKGASTPKVKKTTKATTRATTNPLSKVHFKSPDPREPSEIYWSVEISVTKVLHEKPSKGIDALTFMMGPGLELARRVTGQSTSTGPEL